MPKINPNIITSSTDQEIPTLLSEEQKDQNYQEVVAHIKAIGKRDRTRPEVDSYPIKFLELYHEVYRGTPGGKREECEKHLAFVRSCLDHLTGQPNKLISHSLTRCLAFAKQTRAFYRKENQSEADGFSAVHSALNKIIEAHKSRFLSEKPNNSTP